MWYKARPIVLFPSLVTDTPPLAAAARERGVLLVAAGAAFLALLDDPGRGGGAYTHVYAFCTLATFAVAATALWLITKEHR